MSVYQRPLRPDELMHYGVKGQRWGQRRYQNEDGSYTSAGRMRYGKGDKMIGGRNVSSVTRKVMGDYNNMSNREFKAKYHTSRNRYRKRVNRYGDPYMNAPLAKLGKRLAGQKTGKSAATDAYARREVAISDNSKGGREARKAFNKAESQRLKAARKNFRKNYFSNSVDRQLDIAKNYYKSKDFVKSLGLAGAGYGATTAARYLASKGKNKAALAVGIGGTALSTAGLVKTAKNYSNAKRKANEKYGLNRRKYKGR